MRSIRSDVGGFLGWIGGGGGVNPGFTFLEPKKIQVETLCRGKEEVDRAGDLNVNIFCCHFHYFLKKLRGDNSKIDQVAPVPGPPEKNQMWGGVRYSPRAIARPTKQNKIGI